LLNGPEIRYLDGADSRHGWASQFLGGVGLSPETPD
jgi:uncharacterized protein YgfB (UPF0149 family)